MSFFLPARRLILFKWKDAASPSDKRWINDVELKEQQEASPADGVTNLPGLEILSSHFGRLRDASVFVSAFLSGTVL